MTGRKIGGMIINCIIMQILYLFLGKFIISHPKTFGNHVQEIVPAPPVFGQITIALNGFVKRLIPRGSEFSVDVGLLRGKSGVLRADQILCNGVVLTYGETGKARQKHAYEFRKGQ